jgi:hypothetical protein
MIRVELRNAVRASLFTEPTIWFTQTFFRIYKYNTIFFPFKDCRGRAYRGTRGSLTV